MTESMSLAFLVLEMVGEMYVELLKSSSLSVIATATYNPILLPVLRFLVLICLSTINKENLSFSKAILGIEEILI